MPETHGLCECVFYAESLPADPKFRTVSSCFAPYRAVGHTFLSVLPSQEAEGKDRQECLSYLFTVTLKVPTLPLVSKALNDIVCSPEPSAPKSTE